MLKLVLEILALTSSSENSCIRKISMKISEISKVFNLKPDLSIMANFRAQKDNFGRQFL